MKSGRIVVITGSPGTGKTTVSAIVADESTLERSVRLHTDDFYHGLCKGAIPPHLPESNEQNQIVIEAFLEAAKRFARGDSTCCTDAETADRVQEALAKGSCRLYFMEEDSE